MKICKEKFYGFILLLVTILVGKSFCGIKTESFLSSRKVLLGDVVVYSINFYYTPEYKSILPYEISFSSDSFIVLKKDISKNKKLFSNEYVERHKFYILAVELGKQKILPPVINFVVEGSTQTKNVVVPAIDVEILPVKKIKGVKFDGLIIDIVGPIWLRNYFLLVMFLIVVVVVVVYFLRKKREEVHKEQVVLSEIDVQQETLRKLEQLWQKEYLPNNLIKEFYLELTEIVREYIEFKYKVNAMELTTEELFHSLKNKVDKKYNLELKSFLENADLAKFAKYVPDEKQIRTDFDTAKRLVLEG